MIELKNIKKIYDKVIFDNFNLSILENKITCVLGESGVGKTTLLKMIAGLTPYDGSITGVGKISYIFQEDRLIPHLTVEQNIKLVCADKTEEEITRVLKDLQIESLRHSYPLQLSGGEAKRVSMARAFLFDSEVILMDEAFSSLDLSLKLKLIAYFIQLWKEKPKTVLFVTHDIDEALLLGQKILILNKGIIEYELDLNDSYPRDISTKEEYRREIILNLTKQ